ncbi:MAG: hypothetical protein OHK0022_07330 [Roseiflexaceae bacterium]
MQCIAVKEAAPIIAGWPIMRLESQVMDDAAQQIQFQTWQIAQPLQEARPLKARCSYWFPPLQQQLDALLIQTCSVAWHLISVVV